MKINLSRSQRKIQISGAKDEEIAVWRQLGGSFNGLRSLSTAAIALPTWVLVGASAFSLFSLASHINAVSHVAPTTTGFSAEVSVGEINREVFVTKTSYLEFGGKGIRWMLIFGEITIFFLSVLESVKRLQTALNSRKWESFRDDPKNQAIADELLRLENGDDLGARIRFTESACVWSYWSKLRQEQPRFVRDSIRSYGTEHEAALATWEEQDRWEEWFDAKEQEPVYTESWMELYNCEREAADHYLSSANALPLQRNRKRITNEEPPENNSPLEFDEIEEEYLKREKPSPKAESVKHPQTIGEQLENQLSKLITGSDFRYRGYIDGAIVRRYQFSVPVDTDISAVRRKVDTLKRFLSGKEPQIEWSPDGKLLEAIVPLAEGEGKTLRLRDRLNAIEPTNKPIVELGEDIYGKPIQIDLSQPDTYNLGGIGKSGSGKSIAFSVVLASLCWHLKDPSKLQISPIDPKSSAFVDFGSNNPFFAHPPIADIQKAIKRLEGLNEERESRVRRREALGKRDWLGDDGVPFMPIAIDEITDLVEGADALGGEWRARLDKAFSDLARKGRSEKMPLFWFTQRTVSSSNNLQVRNNTAVAVVLQTRTKDEAKYLIEGGNPQDLAGKGDALVRLPSGNVRIRFYFPGQAGEDIQKIFSS